MKKQLLIISFLAFSGQVSRADFFSGWTKDVESTLSIKKPTKKPVNIEFANNQAKYALLIARLNSALARNVKKSPEINTLKHETMQFIQKLYLAKADVKHASTYS